MSSMTAKNRCKSQPMLSLLQAVTVITITAVVVATVLHRPPTAAGAEVQQPDDGNKWLTGRDLDRFNQLSISAVWADAELRDRLLSFANQQNAAIFLDRRIDPSTPVEIGMNSVTPEQFLWAVGKSCGLGVCRIDNFYYFGPPESAATLPFAIEELNRATSKRRRASKVDWNKQAILKTDSVIEPKRLLEQLADQNGFTIKNLEAIPHDTWAGFDLPATSLDNRVAILLVGFGKWLERSADGTEIVIVDFPSISSGELTIKDVAELKPNIKKYRTQFPSLSISFRGKRLVAKGPAMDLAAFKTELVNAQRSITDDNATKTFTLTTTASRGNILATIAAQTNHVLKFDRTNGAIQKSLQAQIEIRVVNASFDELIAETLKGTNLKSELSGGQLEISER